MFVRITWPENIKPKITIGIVVIIQKLYVYNKTNPTSLRRLVPESLLFDNNFN